jgi:hypothetical protein
MKACAWPGNPPCVNDKHVNKHVEDAERRVGGLTATLVKLYDRIHERVPNARLLIAGYPRLFAPDAQSCSWFLIDRTELLRLNKFAEDLNAAIAAAVLLDNGHGEARNGRQHVPSMFIDLAKAFEGHELCGDGEAWLNDATREGWGPTSYHPNAAGQKGYAEAIANQALGWSP